MSAETTTTSSLDKYNDDDLLNTLLRYGLFVGAIFQLVCIASSILLPPASLIAGSEGRTEVEHKPCGDGIPNIRRLHKLRKQEKKKRR